MSEPQHPTWPHAPLLLAAIGASLVDASTASSASHAARGGATSSILAFVITLSLVLPPLASGAVVASIVLHRREVRALGRGVCAGIGRGSKERARIGLFLGTAILGYAVVSSAIVGRRIIGAVSAHVAAAILALIVVIAIAAALTATAIATSIVAPRLLALEARFPAIRRVTRGFGARVVTTIPVVIALLALLPPDLAPGVLGCTAGWAIAGLGGLGDAIARIRFRRGRSIAIAAFTAMIAAAACLPALPGTAQLSVLRSPPYASLLIAAARRVVDRDHDGYSPILAGGDCDDGDPQVNPGATDVPGNGKDENCTGADAVLYAPSPAPESADTAARASSSPSIVLVHVDALRPDHLHFAGYPRSTSPRIDHFRSSATWFRHTYTPAPSTRYAMSSLFTGLDVERIPQRRGPGNDLTILPEAETLAERLVPLGYDRVGLTLRYVIEHVHGVGQGFRVWKTPWPIDQEADLIGRDAAITSDAALGYLAQFPEEANHPFLLYAHYQCAHAPYVKHAEWDFGNREIDLYDSALAYCDEQVGRLLDALDVRADRARTVVVLFSDHGELLGEKGLEAHGTSLLEPAVRSLLLARVPGYSVTTLDAKVTLTDLAPTLLALAGAPPMKASGAWSLLPFLANGTNETATDRPVFLYVDDWRGDVHYQSRGVVDGPFKYVRDVETGVAELFDERTDPAELVDLERTLPMVRTQLASLVEAWGSYATTAR